MGRTDKPMARIDMPRGRTDKPMGRIDTLRGRTDKPMAGIDTLRGRTDKPMGHQIQKVFLPSSVKAPALAWLNKV